MDFQALQMDGAAFQFQVAFLAGGHRLAIDGRQWVVGKSADAGELDLTGPSRRGGLGKSASRQQGEGKNQDFHLFHQWMVADLSAAFVALASKQVIRQKPILRNHF